MAYAGAAKVDDGVHIDRTMSANAGRRGQSCRLACEWASQVSRDSMALPENVRACMREDEAKYLKHFLMFLAVARLRMPQGQKNAYLPAARLC